MRKSITKVLPPFIALILSLSLIVNPVLAAGAVPGVLSISSSFPDYQSRLDQEAFAPRTLWAMQVVAMHSMRLLRFLRIVRPAELGANRATVVQGVEPGHERLVQALRDTSIIPDMTAEQTAKNPGQLFIFVDHPEEHTFQVAANREALGLLSKGIQRSQLSYWIKRLQLRAARIAEGQNPDQWSIRLESWVIARWSQLRSLTRDGSRPDRPIFWDQLNKIAWDSKLTDPDAWLPVVREGAGPIRITQIPQRKIGPYRADLVKYRVGPSPLAVQMPWEKEAARTGIRNLNFDPEVKQGFHFGPQYDPVDWEVARIASIELGGARRTIRINRAPAERYASLIVPDKTENQYFQVSDAQTIIDFFSLELEDSGAYLGYNSLFGTASQNSKHFQLFYEEAQIFGRGTRWLTQQGNVRVGVLQRGAAWSVRILEWLGLGNLLRDYPGGVIRLQSDDPVQLRDSLMQLVQVLHAQSTPFSLVARRGDILVTPIRQEWHDSIQAKKGIDLHTPVVISDEKIWKHLTQEQIEAVIAEGTYPVGDIEQMIHTAFTDNPLERITSRTIRFPLEGIANVIEGKTVLVTGGGGMIGSSLINELVTLDPAAIVVADFDENSVDQLQLELKNRGFKGKLITPLINLQNSADTEQLFVRYRPQVVFHLAAYKNTQMMEAYPEEGFLNNVAITLNVVQAASRSPGMERFVFASSVRADEPVGVYDKTKAAGEVIVRSLLAQAPFRYALVRFANIYENSPVRAEFTASAERGQPIMIANPNGKRFFMRSDEAAKLLLSAALHGEKGEVFLADMGAPVNILDLARSIIRKVTKREPVEGVTYQVGTPRTHERLMDERLFDPGSVDARRLADVYMLRTSSETPDPAWLVSEINNLTESLRQGESAAIKVLAVLDGILLESGIRLGILPNPRAGGLNPCIREIEEAS